MKWKLPRHWRVLVGVLIIVLVAAVIAGRLIPGQEGDLQYVDQAEEALGLPEVDAGRSDVTDSIYHRQSVRSYADEPVTQEELAVILWSTIGITVDTVSGPTRAAPSAGATDPLETYVFVQDAVDLEPGIYRYQVEDHALVKTVAGEAGDALASAGLGQPQLANAPITVVLTAHYERTTGRYGDRGVRYVHMEAGHAAQNAALVAQDMGIGSVMIGAFNDDEVSDLLGEDAGDPLYLIPMGHMSP